MNAQAERARTFRALHAGEPFVIPNPWDAGSARVLATLGFRALATTSSGLAFTLGRLDGTVLLDEVVEHVRALTAATDLPLSVDLENGYGAEPADAARAVLAVAEAGAVGGSIEDWDRDDGRLYDLGHAAARVAAAVDAARSLSFPFVLTARAENHVHGVDDLDDTIRRLQAYEAAGADVLFAPGLRTPDEVRRVRAAVAKPLNVLAFPGMSLEQLFEAGAQRVSVGGGLAWASASALADAARAILERGDLSGLASGARVREWLA
jgi:2-methylisocitrate lyase-like PEP mutase family enzyme